MSGEGGFSQLAKIKPATTTVRGPDHRVDEAGERHGFVSREAPPQLMKLKQTVHAHVSQINVRAETDDLNIFMAWCREERISYREALKRIVAAIKKGAV